MPIDKNYKTVIIRLLLVVVLFYNGTISIKRYYE